MFFRSNNNSSSTSTITGASKQLQESNLKQGPCQSNKKLQPTPSFKPTMNEENAPRIGRVSAFRRLSNAGIGKRSRSVDFLISKNINNVSSRGIFLRLTQKVFPTGGGANNTKDFDTEFSRASTEASEASSPGRPREIINNKPTSIAPNSISKSTPPPLSSVVRHGRSTLSKTFYFLRKRGMSDESTNATNIASPSLTLSQQSINKDSSTNHHHHCHHHNNHHPLIGLHCSSPPAPHTTTSDLSPIIPDLDVLKPLDSYDSPVTDIPMVAKHSNNSVGNNKNKNNANKSSDTNKNNYRNNDNRHHHHHHKVSQQSPSASGKIFEDICLKEDNNNGNINNTSSSSLSNSDDHNQISYNPHLTAGLYLDSIDTKLPGCLMRAIEIIPGRFYWMTCTDPAILNVPGIASYSTDEELVYDPFYADFGPLNLGMTYRYCRRLVEIFRSSNISTVRIVHYSSPSDYKRANAAYLAATFCIIILGWTAQRVTKLFEHVKPSLLPFRDATYGTCRYQLKLSDCCAGLAHAISLGWFDYETFDLESYEFYEKPENGDLHWIIPNKFVAFSGPESRKRDDVLFVNFTPEDYVPIFHKLGVKLVVRLNEKQYDKKLFTANGINHTDMYFVDGSCPSRELIYKFLDVVEQQEGAIAVHCKAGLGRTGTVIGCYAIKHCGFTGRSWIGWNRICRPGSVLGPQQQFLCEIEKELRGAKLIPNINNNTISSERLTSSSLVDLLQEMTLEDKRTATTGDMGQGNRLISVKRNLHLPPTEVPAAVLREDFEAEESKETSITKTMSTPLARQTSHNEEIALSASLTTPPKMKHKLASASNNGNTVLEIEKRFVRG